MALEAKHDEGSRAMFDVKAPMLITGGTFNITTGGADNDNHRQKVYKAFERYVAQNATNDSIEIMDAPRCHPKTRRAILKKVVDWVTSQNSDRSETMLWLHGPAGAGKTAIGHSLAEMLSVQGQLGATFFFLRTADTRNNARLLITTLAYNLALTIPEIFPFLSTTVENSPYVFQQSLETQMERFIVNPVLSMSLSASSAGSANANVPCRALIIDGLDECNDRNVQTRILTIIASVAPRLAGKIKFLIFSRPEFHLEATFKSPKLRGITRIIGLKDDLSALDDILIFLEDRFEDIKQKHPLQSIIDPSWPSSEDIEELVQRSCGNFIYPQVITKYIEAEYDRPQKRLQVILDLSPTSDAPYGELDALYRHILSGARVDRALLLRILGVISIFRSDPQNVLLACTTQFQERILFLEPGDIPLKLLDLRSIITFESYIVKHPYFCFPNILHTSLFDFLVDYQRSRELCIDWNKMRNDTARGILLFIERSISELANASRKDCNCRSHLLCDHKWYIFYDALLWVSAAPTSEMQHAVMNHRVGLVYDLILAEDEADVQKAWADCDIKDPFEYHQAKYYDFLKRALNKYHLSGNQSVLATILALFSTLGTQLMIPEDLAQLVRPCVSFLQLYHPSNDLPPARQKLISEEISKKDIITQNFDFQTIVNALIPHASGELKNALLFTERIIPEENEYTSARVLAAFLSNATISGQYYCGDKAWYDATVYCLNFLRSDGPSQDLSCIAYFLEAIARLLVLQLYYESSKILPAGQVASEVIYLPKKIGFPIDHSFLVGALSYYMTLASSYRQSFTKISFDAAKFCDIARAFHTVIPPSSCLMSHTDLKNLTCTFFDDIHM
ncbi:hypothetical protein CVT25_011634 [Psilocybe cyanescens]|uniref:Nephrocystin 3-like N-terminal domain-containing protein n=1 Tax=Psilocybe cyanescens TaxID=93625 RepID=A0A409WIQ0_PSICY|nr:hypothetical protein CVT25_011634 [Psilocybe cyanescens]